MSIFIGPILLLLYSPLFLSILGNSNLSIFIILGILLIIILTITFLALLNSLRVKYRKKIGELKQQLLLSQMNPHFVFNSLTAIQSYIFRNEPYMAGKYMASFSKLVRLILENSRSQLIPISKEKDTLSYYLELQLLRFEGKFDFSIQVDENIDLEHHAIPPMLAQPFIENAIEHGIIHLSSKGLISISFSLKEPHIILEVEDNGIGIEKSLKENQQKRSEHQSLAMKITRERLQNLKNSNGVKVRLDIFDLSNQPALGKQGTLVRFTIPVSFC